MPKKIPSRPCRTRCEGWSQRCRMEGTVPHDAISAVMGHMDILFMTLQGAAAAVAAAGTQQAPPAQPSVMQMLMQPPPQPPSTVLQMLQRPAAGVQDSAHMQAVAQSPNKVNRTGMQDG